MNKSKIPWCDFSWNPITGCKMNCPSCFARKIANRFAGVVRLNLNNIEIEKDTAQDLFTLYAPLHIKKNSVVQFPTGFYPTFHKYRLDMIWRKKKPANIYVGSIGDMFGDFVPTDWILEVFQACKAAPWHNYLFMTCNPKRYTELAEQGLLPAGHNYWYGSKIAANKDVFTMEGYHSFVLIEPIEKYDMRHKLSQIEWIIIACETLLPSKRNLADRKHIERFIKSKGDIPLFMSNDNNMRAVWNGKPIQEFPVQLQRPKDKPIPHCKKCKFCYMQKEGKRGFRHTCRHKKILVKYKGTNGRHIEGRFARTSPAWCPKR